MIRALDTNGDGIIEADEIANAPQSLKTLLKSGSDSLTIPDLMGPRPPRPGGPGPQGGPEASGTNTQQGGPDGQQPPPPPDGQGGQGGDDQGPPPPPPDGEGGQGGQGGPGGAGGHHPRPLPQVVLALDANHDGIVDANEIANAAAELKTLDKNGDGQLTRDEYGPVRPPRNGQGPPPPPGESGTNGENEQGGPPPPPQ